jgi:hypothetical protein
MLAEPSAKSWRWPLVCSASPDVTRAVTVGASGVTGGAGGGVRRPLVSQ